MQFVDPQRCPAPNAKCLLPDHLLPVCIPVNAIKIYPSSLSPCPSVEDLLQHHSLHTSEPDNTCKMIYPSASFADPGCNRTGTRAFLNNPHLPFDANLFPSSLIANVGDSNDARWEPTSLGPDSGTAGVVDAGSAAGSGVKGDHGANLPLLFQLIQGIQRAGRRRPSYVRNRPVACKMVLR
ncbi:hypothetical protein BUE80_DR002348, partial [Diplocarpon rosae]